MDDPDAPDRDETALRRRVPVTAAIIPYREPAKSRLAAGDSAVGLAAPARTLLARAMLADVVTAIRAAGVADVVVAAGDPAAARVAVRLGLPAVPDASVDGGLNAAVDAAAGSLGADAVLVVTADLPTLRALDVATVVGTEGEVVVAPTNRAGTGGLLRRPALVVPASYGPSSARRHADAARDAGLTVTVLDLPGFRDDVDTPGDLAALSRERLGPATRRAIQHLGLG